MNGEFDFRKFSFLLVLFSVSAARLMGTTSHA